MSEATAEVVADERVTHRSLLARMTTRPELGALVGAIAVFVFFAFASDTFLQANSLATVFYSASTLGLMTVGVSLLMIGGEFDLSAGVIVPTAALSASMFAYQLTLNVWVGAAFSLAVALAIGAFNGFLRMRTGLHSFIITLGMFLMLQGLNLAVTKLVTGNVSSDSIADMDGFSSAQAVFASDIPVFGINIKITVLWWIAFVALATWILLRTRVGNWIYAVGGAEPSARAVGVPVVRTKIGLFMGVSFMGWFSGMHLLFGSDRVQSGEGVGNELLYIVTAVVGGCLLTGGYGSAIGAAIGALIFGMVDKGIVYAQWDPDWFMFFLGIMLLAAVLLNYWVRRRGEESK